MTTTTTVPDEFFRVFDAILLSRPAPKFCDDSETLHKIYLHIKRKLSKKISYNAKRAEKYYKLEQEFLKIYERIKEKEKDFETKNGHAFQRPFDFFAGPDRNGKSVYKKIRYKRSS